MGIFDKIIGKKKTEEKPKAKPVKAIKKAEVKEPVLKPKAQPVTTLKPKAEALQPAAPAVNAKKAKKENTDLAYRILVKPLITEKATNLVSLNKYAFKVAPKANKIEIKKAIKALYGFDPVSINIINERGKRVISGRTRGKKSNWKKAIITLKAGNKLEIYEGV